MPFDLWLWFVEFYNRTQQFENVIIRHVIERPVKAKSGSKVLFSLPELSIVHFSEHSGNHFQSRLLKTDFHECLFLHVCVLKQAKSHDLFYIWLTKLSAHRIYKKNEAMTLHQGVLHALSSGSSTLPAMASLAQRNRAMSCIMVSAKPGY